MKTLYFECESGISGDMTVAALLDIGADEDALLEGLESLGIGGYKIKIGRVDKSGINACDFDVQLEHTHHSHTNDHHDHHEHRNLGDIIAIIRNSEISPNAKAMAEKIFRVVAEAEAVVHGKPLDEVHFHEVGAVDSIVDIVATAICVDNLGAGRVICSPLCEGTGTIRCQHGVIPVPAPATLEIVRSHKIPMTITDNQGEMVTPTGAAIVAALAEEFRHPQSCVVKKTGYGAGKREYKTANVLRAMLLTENVGDSGGDSVIKLECNLDDITGEELGYACELLRESGALDVWCTPIQMKKSRPGYMLSVLALPEVKEHMAELMFRHTSTIGLRCSTHHRIVMERRVETRQTEYGPVEIKEASYGEICKLKPEFENLKQLAKDKNLSISQISRSAYNSDKNCK